MAEMIGTNRALSLIRRRIDASHASPPRSALWSNQTSTLIARSASQMRRAASPSCDA
ncbi:MAG TPA: hypothetical protein VF304_19080 [Casimicrobiaceae bacterium]